MLLLFLLFYTFLLNMVILFSPFSCFVCVCFPMIYLFYVFFIMFYYLFSPWLLTWKIMCKVSYRYTYRDRFYLSQTIWRVHLSLKFQGITCHMLVIYMPPADIPGRLQNGANAGWMYSSANRTVEGEIRQDYVEEGSRAGKCIASKFPLTRHPVSGPSRAEKVMCRLHCSPI